MSRQNGNCNCGSVRISLKELPEQTMACHCLNCRKSGGAFSINYLVANDAVEIDDPKNLILEYQDSNTTSGKAIQRGFCQQCGSPIYTKASPELFIVKASLFEDVVSERGDIFQNREIHWSKK